MPSSLMIRVIQPYAVGVKESRKGVKYLTLAKVKHTLRSRSNFDDHGQKMDIKGSASVVVDRFAHRATA